MYLECKERFFLCGKKGFIECIGGEKGEKHKKKKQNQETNQRKNKKFQITKQLKTI